MVCAHSKYINVSTFPFNKYRCYLGSTFFPIILCALFSTIKKWKKDLWKLGNIKNISNLGGDAA